MVSLSNHSEGYQGGDEAPHRQILRRPSVEGLLQNDIRSIFY